MEPVPPSRHPIVEIATVSAVLFSTAFAITTAVLRSRTERELLENAVRERVQRLPRRR